MATKLQSITDIPELRGKKVLLRASLNVPIADNEVKSSFRLMQILSTVQHLTKQGAKVIIIGHIGRGDTATLKPVYEVLKEHISISWCDEIVSDKARDAIEELGDGDVILLENLRQHAGEVANDESFAKELASLADAYINDAFPVSHREHASIVGVPQFLPSYAGLIFINEVTELSKALEPEHPALFILGGAKFETKEPLVRKFIDIYDKVFVGGALANDFWHTKGIEIGTSKVSGQDVPTDVVDNPKIMLPTHVVVENASGDRETKKVEEVATGEKILDVLLPEGFSDGMKTILWNGPLGYYEGGYDAGTVAVAMLIAKSDAHTIVGGGDTVAAIERLGLNSKFNFVSTAGGAMLQFLESGTLPGIESLTRAK